MISSCLISTNFCSDNISSLLSSASFLNLSAIEIERYIFDVVAELLYIPNSNTCLTYYNTWKFTNYTKDRYFVTLIYCSSYYKYPSFLSLITNLQIKSPLAALCVVSILAPRSFSNNSVSVEHASQCFSAICIIGQLYSKRTCFPSLFDLDSAIYPSSSLILANSLTCLLKSKPLRRYNIDRKVHLVAHIEPF